MMKEAAHQAVEAVQKRDRRIRRAFVFLALFMVVLLAAHTWVGVTERDTLQRQVDILEAQGERQEILLQRMDEQARVSQAIVRRLRAEFRRRTSQSERLQRRTIRFARRLVIAARRGQPLPRVPEPFFAPTSPSENEGGGGGGASSPPQSPSQPPPQPPSQPPPQPPSGPPPGPPPEPPPVPPGRGNPKACENPGKACR